jgi:BirA family biotin operon repressor/biotin-[acetyl-CoA-carboxylase] ligase
MKEPREKSGAGAHGGRPAEILALLRAEPGACVSGAEMSRRLGISRAAVWKHIVALRAAGFVIEAHPSQGYRLAGAPDLLLPSEVQRGLETQFVARDIRHFPTTDSTNRVALDLAEHGASEGTTVIAEAQTAGRGRLGRHWHSPPRANLYASVILRPSVPLAQASQLVLVGAVAAQKAIESCYDGPPETAPRIKWPNDILLGTRKVSGTLVETASSGELVRHLVLGIGINVNLAEKDLPEEIRGIATSLAIACGHPVSRVELARRLFGEIEAAYVRFRQEGFARLALEYADRSALWGRTVRVTLPEGTVEGVAEGLDPDGALRLRLPSGITERILAGDVQLLR